MKKQRPSNTKKKDVKTSKILKIMQFWCTVNFMQHKIWLI